jgi:hypothetical protein
LLWEGTAGARRVAGVEVQGTDGHKRTLRPDKVLLTAGAFVPARSFSRAASPRPMAADAWWASASAATTRARSSDALPS